jgi:hypothetical protein
LVLYSTPPAAQAWEPAAASPAVTYPAGLERDQVAAWLRAETDIAPSEVIAISPSAVISIASAERTADPPPYRVTLHAEALSRGVASENGLVSWQMTLEADCAGRRVKSGETKGHARRNLQGEARPLRSVDIGWRPPPPGTSLESAWRAVCDPGFVRPLFAAAPVIETRSPSRASPDRREASTSAHHRAGAPTDRGIFVQVVAASTADEATEVLRTLVRNPSGGLVGLPTRVLPAAVAGRTVYRGLFGGFEAREQASRLCVTIRTMGRDCFVREIR